MFFKSFRRSKPQTDTEFISAYQQSGNLDVLGELYEKYMEMVFAICYKYLRDEEASKDAVMQIFEQLIDDLKKHNVENFKSWLHSVARNYCLMQLRMKKITTEDFEFQEDENMESEVFLHLIEENDDFEIEENLQKLEKCLEILSTEQKACVEMFYLKEKCYKEISEITNFDLTKVKSHIQNGKRNLKICMEK